MEGYTPDLGTVLTWRGQAARCSLSGEQMGLCYWWRFFLFALILFVKLLEWMTVRAMVQQSNGSVLLKGNQTGSLHETERVRVCALA